jgi:hypothetical protein
MNARGPQAISMPIRCLSLVFVFLLLPVAFAQAEQGVVRDARGDAKASWDITKLMVDNGARKLRIQVHYRGRLRPKYGLGLLTNVRLDLGAPADSVYSGDFYVDMLRGSSDPQAPNRFDLVRSDNYNVVRCEGLQLRVRYDQGLLEFVVPQRCFGGLAGRVRVTGFTYTPRGTADKADYIRHWGAWIPQGQAVLNGSGLREITGMTAKRKLVSFISPQIGSKPEVVQQGAHGQFYDLNWERWGEKQAVAQGRLLYSDETLPGFDAPATLIAMNLRTCGPWRVYTKWKAVTQPDAEGRVFPEQNYDLRGCPTLYCGEVTAFYPDVEGGAGVEVFAESMRCRDARRVVVRCIKRDRVPGWGKARYDDGEMILTKGRKKITMEGTAGGAPHCVAL